MIDFMMFKYMHSFRIRSSHQFPKFWIFLSMKNHSNYGAIHLNDLLLHSYDFGFFNAVFFFRCFIHDREMRMIDYSDLFVWRHTLVQLCKSLGPFIAIHWPEKISQTPEAFYSELKTHRFGHVFRVQTKTGPTPWIDTVANILGALPPCRLVSPGVAWYILYLYMQTRNGNSLPNK